MRVAYDANTEESTDPDRPLYITVDWGGGRLDLEFYDELNTATFDIKGDDGSTLTVWFDWIALERTEFRAGCTNGSYTQLTLEDADRAIRRAFADLRADGTPALKAWIDGVTAA